ncbi:DNA polymerase III subunit alpha [Oceanivirga salmonicida]|uniref:DNA polymerase III subunit alpha n=1 Tax=Oceanivirga salmonicida TaxID=1769291 RepID=UPI0008308BF3|nr:DNA polymerase III subunit alpha [Oceanivirga salmonicida]
MYINLKLHTDYTLLEATAKVDDYLKRIKEYNQKSMAITNTSLFGTINYYEKALKLGIKPIIALELYTYGLEIEGEFAITVYAKNIDGYKALIKLSTVSNNRRIANRNIIDIQEISKYSKDLVVLVGGINSEVFKSIDNLDYAHAKNVVIKYNKYFDDFYLELPAFNMLKRNIEEYIDIIKETETKFVITNDVYYLDKGDAFIQKIVTAIKENRNLSSIKTAYKPEDLYLKDYNQISKDLEYIDKEIFDEGIKSIGEIVDKCNVEIELSNKELPIYLKNINEKEVLKDLVYKGLKEKNITDDRYIKRIEYEISVIDKMGFNSYFLITQDIVKFARENKILVGVGRGSAAGSLVSYLLDITKIDPIKYDLIFERFLNAGRKSMPDIDLDFEANRREEVISYVMQRYGQDYVSNIVTFSTLKEKQILRDLTRVLNKTLSKDDKSRILSKLLDNVRHSSIHASGVIISREKLENIVPIYKDLELKINVSQYDMKELEHLGLLKMDFLALANLDIISETIKDINIDLDNIELDNQKAFELYNKGDTIGLFQVESMGITSLIKRFKINSIHDISAALALYRPGPLGSGMVDDVIKRKNKLENIEYEIDDLKGILDNTYGIMIYQEQVMQIAQKIADYSLIEADDLRRAISKKKPDILEKHKINFITKAVEKGYDKQKIEKLYSQIEAFGDYGFNKSHSISYAIISYYTAYLKANYTKEYMKALLNHKITDYNKLNVYFNELEKYNIKLEKPSINNSNVFFVVENENIRYAFYSISGISQNLASDIVFEREKSGKFTDINDFTYRMTKYGINQRQLESLALAGVFDEFEISRKEVQNNAKEILEIAKKIVESDENITRTLFFTDNSSIAMYEKKNIDEYSLIELSNIEITKLGLPLLYYNSKEYENLKTILILKNNIELAYVYSKDKIISNGVEYKNNLRKDITKYINKPCFIRKNKNYISDIFKLKEITNVKVNILLDNLSDEKKLNIKKIMKQNTGNIKVNFYNNNIKLDGKVYIELSYKTISQLVKEVSVNNIKIVIS